jgi:hypothetical protein
MSQLRIMMLTKSCRGRTALSFADRCWISVLLLAMCLMPGCGGCTNSSLPKGKSQKDLEEELAKKDEEKKEDFQFKDMIVKPNDPNLEVKTAYAKPGHWTAGMLTAIANNDDFQGDLIGRCTDVNGKPLPTENTLFRLVVSRPVSLPKGQEKDLEIVYYVPRRLGGNFKTSTLSYELRSRNGKVLFQSTRPVSLMPEYQYYMPILSNSPDEFRYISLLDCVTVPAGEFSETKTKFYQTTFPAQPNRCTLPNQSLLWSSIAYLVWDDFDPNFLTEEQQVAMLDWLHFGGQLIVAGPTGLDKLQNSFLANYLPAKNKGSRNLTTEDVAELNNNWSVKDSSERKLVINPDSPLLGADLELTGNGTFFPGTGNLVAEMAVGRGRVVVAGFAVSGRTITNWQSIDGFFNSVLLRRPAREFAATSLGLDISESWVDFPASFHDPMLSSTVRYLSRDMGANGTPTETEVLLSADNAVERSEADAGQLSRGRTNLEQDHWHFGGYRDSARSGVGGWSDASGVSVASRSILQNAAGISPPSANFVLRMIAIYLVVLVPVNWGLFRLIGRVEWAWIAAPIIAIVGALTVVRMARLDIGFARSQTEIATLELFADHPRGHLTRFSALYSSLSTSYDLAYNDDSAQAQPFAKGESGLEFNRTQESDVTFRREQRDWILRDLPVASNSTEFIHSEQMLPLKGPIRWQTGAAGNYQLVNESELSIYAAGVLLRDKDGVLKKAWLGEIAAGETRSITWQSDTDNSTTFSQWLDSNVTSNYESQANLLIKQHDQDGNGTLSELEVASLPEIATIWPQIRLPNYRPKIAVRNDELKDDVVNVLELAECLRINEPSGEISLGALFDMVQNNLVLGPMQARLVGWSDAPLPSMKVTPSAPQVTQRTLIVAHLSPGRFPTAKRDKNTRFPVLEKIK